MKLGESQMMFTNIHSHALPSSMAVAFLIPATCNLQQDNWESHLQHQKSVFRIHSMGVGTHQAWERNRQQWMSWMGWFIWGSEVHTTVASSNYNMTLTRICYRWCMWNCRKSAAVICFSTLQWIVHAPKLSVSPNHSTGPDSVCMHTKADKTVPIWALWKHYKMQKPTDVVTSGPLHKVGKKFKNLQRYAAAEQTFI